jgi:hypothetical protein
MKKKKRGFPIKLLIALLIAVLSLTLTFCFSDEEEETTPTDQLPTAGSLTLRVSQTSVKSDNSDSATVTATVLDRTSAVIEGKNVIFSATGGQFNSSSSVATDAYGEASIEFSSGADSSNQSVTIAASVDGLTREVPIQITGSTITLSSSTTNLEIGGNDTDTLTITVKDAGSFYIYGAEVTLSVDSSSTGAVSLTPETGTTDVNGKLEVQVTGTQSGNVTLRVEAVGTTKTQAYTVSATGSAFGISSPTTDPYSLSTNTNLTITVNAPNQTQVRFATTLGYWDSTTEMVRDKSVGGGTASAVLRSTEAGVATVQVSDPNNPSTTDSLKVAISAPTSEAAQISLQANATVVAPSTGDTSNSITLTAIVKNASGQIVGGAAVHFSITDPTGGGEFISPVISYTDDYGEATSTFTSGSLSTDAEGVTVKATVVGTTIEDTIAIVIGGTAGSVTIGRGTSIYSINDDTAYQLPIAVLVSDSNGNAVSGATVSLNLWPSHYATGCWTSECVPGDCPDPQYMAYPNEDTNKNSTMDTGEDTNGDGVLTPPSSAAGSLPRTVTCDENGVANFNLVYLKASAAWIEDEITASTEVLGTETQSTYRLGLPWAEADCGYLPHSPYNP